MVKKVLISVPEQLLKVIDDVATDENRTRSELLREAFRQYARTRQQRHQRTGEYT
ncbi:MAG: ribbon-helix-helix protein, CopG family [Flavobacteriales bacterium]